MNLQSGPKVERPALVKNKLEGRDFDKLVTETSQSLAIKFPKFSQLSDGTGELEASLSQEKGDSEPSAQDQPKRPMNAFMVWAQAIRRELHDNFSNIQNALLSKALGRVWRSMDPKEKDPFVKRASAIKVIHKRKYPNYRYQPRRTQDRRAKSNLLIGISLDHPVNEPHFAHVHASQSDQTTRYLPLEQSTGGTLGPDRGNRNQINWRSRDQATSQSYDQLTADRTAAEVQTFRYYPYPTGQSAGSVHHDTMAHGASSLALNSGSSSNQHPGYYSDSRTWQAQHRGHQSYHYDSRCCLNSQPPRDRQSQAPTVSFTYNEGYTPNGSSNYHDTSPRFM